MVTSRCRDVRRFSAGDARVAIVGFDRRHNRFGREGARYRRMVRHHSAVSPRTAGGCMARTMRKPNRARSPSDAALLLL
jgi:hypothetical protein